MAAKMVLAALKHIWATLEPTSCSHALIGGLSFSFWKHVRTTQDVDLLIDSGSARELLLEGSGAARVLLNECPAQQLSHHRPTRRRPPSGVEMIEKCNSANMKVQKFLDDLVYWFEHGGFSSSRFGN